MLALKHLMPDSCSLWLKNHDTTRFAGASLAETLYERPLTITLSGELGTGKTTFLQGFASALGIDQAVTSPTFALEQRYETNRHGELLHLDLYRLTESQARELVASSDHHHGIRCIEWPERLGKDVQGNSIRITLKEDGDGRRIGCNFEDMPLPSPAQILEWRKDVRMPDHIARHCDAVAFVCDRLSKRLLAEGKILRPAALYAAAKVHDLLRFVDFRDGAHPPGYEESSDDQHIWAHWMERFAGMKHEIACAAFLRSERFAGVATIVETHGLALPPAARSTIEQKILYYADKRVMNDRIVSIEERFADFVQRYGKGSQSDQLKAWQSDVRHVEAELFPDREPQL